MYVDQIYKEALLAVLANCNNVPGGIPGVITDYETFTTCVFGCQATFEYGSLIKHHPDCYVYKLGLIKPEQDE